jgi:chromosome segregation protein
MQAQRADELAAAMERARGEIALAERQTSAQEDLIRSLTAEMEEVSTAFQQAEQICQEAQEKAALARKKREEAVAVMESIRSRREAARREAEGARARGSAEEMTIRQRSESLERLRQEITGKESEEQTEKSVLEELFRRLQEAETLFPEARERLQKAEEALRRAEAVLVDADKKLSEADAEKMLARSREEALRERSAGEAEACLKVWMEKGQTGGEALWPGLKVRPGYEAAISLALGPVLDGVLVDDLDKMAESLETGEGGPSGILLSRQISGVEATDWPEGAWNFVEGGSGWGTLLPNLLAGICIVDSWEEAQALRSSRPEAMIICRDGRMISPRGWQRRGKARLTRPGRAEIEAARDTAIRAEQAASDLSVKVSQAKDHIENARDGLEQSRDHEKAVRQGLDEVRREHDRKEALVRAFSAETSRRREEIQRFEQEILVHQKIATEKSSEVEKFMALEQGLELEARKSEEARIQAEAEESRLNELLTERRVDRSAQQQKRDSCNSQLQPAEARRKELVELVNKRREEIGADTARMESARAESQASLEAQHAASHRAQEIEGSTAGLKQARDTEVALLTEKEAEVVRWRQDGEKAKDRLAELAVKGSQLDFQRQALAERLQRDYSTPLMDAKVEGEGMPQTEEEWAKLEEDAKALKEKMDEMGPVNTEAISEYEELENRLKFLETEEKDLTTAKAQLEEAIRKINQTTRLLFEETFDKVRINFGTLFGELFGGGRATVKMTEGDDALEGGIDIEAQPPGKQPKNISQLSGGEKAMTALALLLAIYSVKPSPFCVLDEMDAPLDETNTVRFVQIIERFVEKSQFLVITHNKRTMSSADLLYGVTATEPGVSRMMSIKLTRDEETPLFAPAEA